MYKGLLYFWPDFALGLYAERKAIAGIIATFAFTMTGFLAAIITFMFNYYESHAFSKYRKEGFFEVFLLFYYTCILYLLVTCFLSLLCHSNTTSMIGIVLFVLVSANFINNIFHIALISFAIYSLAKKAATEDS